MLPDVRPVQRCLMESRSEPCFPQCSPDSDQPPGTIRWRCFHHASREGCDWTDTGGSVPNIRLKSFWSAGRRSMEASVLLGTFSVVSAAFPSSTAGPSICTGGTSVLVAVPLWNRLCQGPRWLTIIHFNDIRACSPGTETEKNSIQLREQSGKGQRNLCSFCLFFV